MFKKVCEFLLNVAGIIYGLVLQTVLISAIYVINGTAKVANLCFNDNTRNARPRKASPTSQIKMRPGTPHPPRYLASCSPGSPISESDHNFSVVRRGPHALPPSSPVR